MSFLPPSIDLKSAPPAELTPRVLSIRRKNGRLILATPTGRHALIGLLCVALPLFFWVLQAITAPKSIRMSAGIEQAWLAFLIDHVLPDPTAVPLHMNLVALAFALIGVVLLGHSLTSVIDREGITTVHYFCFLPYWRARVSRRDILSYTVEVNGKTVHQGEELFLYCIKANCTTPPQSRFCGFAISAPESGKTDWQEWLVFSLPSEEAAAYVLALVQEICPLPG